jgi:hypothetical protein
MTAVETKTTDAATTLDSLKASSAPTSPVSKGKGKGKRKTLAEKVSTKTSPKKGKGESITIGKPGIPAYGKVNTIGDHRGFRQTEHVIESIKVPKTISSVVKVGVTSVGAARGNVTLPSTYYISKSALLRWCGAKGFTIEQCTTLLAALGMQATKANVNCQRSSGARYTAGDGIVAYTTVDAMNAMMKAVTKADETYLRKLAGIK